MTINIDFKFKKLRKKLSKKTALLLMLTIIVHVAIVLMNSDTVARHRAAFGYSLDYHKKLVSDIKTEIELQESDNTLRPSNY